MTTLRASAYRAFGGRGLSSSPSTVKISAFRDPLVADAVPLADLSEVSALPARCVFDAVTGWRDVVDSGLFSVVGEVAELSRFCSVVTVDALAFCPDIAACTREARDSGVDID